MHDKPIAAGKSSFDLVEAGKVFRQLNLNRDTVFLDIASGIGRYTLAAADIINGGGEIIAIDLWQEGIEQLRQQLAARGIANARTVVGDVGKSIPVEDGSIDVALMATVLHDLIQVKAGDGALREAARVLKNNGTLAIIEFHKIDGPPGPPIAVRLSPAELAALVTPFGFAARETVDVGPYNYITTFRRSTASA